MARTPATTDTPLLKCAIVEFNFYHDEVLPTLVFLLNGMGIVPDVYLPKRAILKDVFSAAPDLRFALMRIDGMARFRGTPSRFQKYDIVIANSIEPADVLRRVAASHAPTLAVLHNADLVAEGPYQRFLAGPRRTPIVLARHVSEAIDPGGSVQWIAPVYLGGVAEVPHSGGPTRLCVQGNVEFARRNYTS